MCLVTQLYLTLCDPMDCSLPDPSAHGDSTGQITGVGNHSLLPGDHPNPGIKPRSPALQADSLLSEKPGKLSHKGSHQEGLEEISNLPQVAQLTWSGVRKFSPLKPQDISFSLANNFPSEWKYTIFFFCLSSLLKVLRKCLHSLLFSPHLIFYWHRIFLYKVINKLF